VARRNNGKLTNVEIERWLTIRTKAASRVKIQIRSQANTFFQQPARVLAGFADGLRG
jgi:hypothetical protein